jgi:hypothetical protein
LEPKFRRFGTGNIWRVKLGAWIDDANGSLEPAILLDAVCGEMFRADPNTPTRLTATWTPSSKDRRGGSLARPLSPRGRMESGTSVWFVGATGLASCADDTTFVAGGG